MGLCLKKRIKNMLLTAEQEKKHEWTIGDGQEASSTIGEVIRLAG